MSGGAGGTCRWNNRSLIAKCPHAAPRLRCAAPFPDRSNDGRAHRDRGQERLRPVAEPPPVICGAGARGQPRCLVRTVRRRQAGRARGPQAARVAGRGNGRLPAAAKLSGARFLDGSSPPCSRRSSPRTRTRPGAQCVRDSVKGAKASGLPIAARLCRLRQRQAVCGQVCDRCHDSGSNRGSSIPRVSHQGRVKIETIEYGRPEGKLRARAADEGSDYRRLYR
jgi:hypothetical protein